MRNDEFIDVVEGEISKRAHAPVEAVVDGEQLAVVPDFVDGARWKRPWDHRDCSVTFVMLQHFADVFRHVVCIEVEMLGTEEFAQLDKLYECYGGNGPKQRRNAHSESALSRRFRNRTHVYYSATVSGVFTGGHSDRAGLGRGVDTRNWTGKNPAAVSVAVVFAHLVIADGRSAILASNEMAEELRLVT